MNSCYYWHKSHATKTGVAVRIVLEVVRYSTAEAHYRDFNLSAFVLAVEFYNFAPKLFKKHFGSKPISKNELCVFKEL